MAKKWRELYERTFSPERRAKIEAEVQRELAKMRRDEVRRAASSPEVPPADDNSPRS
jgi:hypothetical protein